MMLVHDFAGAHYVLWVGITECRHKPFRMPWNGADRARTFLIVEFVRCVALGQSRAESCSAICSTSGPFGKGTHSRTDDVMKQLAYLYDYDGRGRLVSKKLPGAAFAEYRYDPAGRIVAERDGRLAGDTWHLYVYDGCGRQVAKYRCGMMDDEITEFASVCRTASLTTAADEYDRGGYTLTPVSTAWPGDVVWA